MGIIERVNELKKEGLDDSEISNRLLEEKVPPQKIKEVFDQLKIKKAVSSENNMEMSIPSPDTTMDPNYKMNYEQNNQNFNAEVLPEETPSQEEYYYPKANTAPLPPPAQDYSQQEEYYSPQEYSSYPGSYSQQAGGYDTNTMIEIAEQVFSEKTSAMEKQFNKINEFVRLAEMKISNNDERIKRMEKIIDSLQIKILEKVSSYGENIEGIKKEMEMMQDSFSKTLPDLYEHKKKK